MFFSIFKGRAWKMHNKDLLVREVISTYSVQSKYESFSRQLNGWGFKRLHQSGNDNSAYYHEVFLRGLPQLTALMRRATPNQGKLVPNIEGEPNFYEMDKKYPLRPPSMPHDGYYDYNPMTGAAGFGPPQESLPGPLTGLPLGPTPGPPHRPPPEPPVGYHGINQYSSYPNMNYPPPLSEYGHSGDTCANAAPAYTRQLDYPTYAFLPMRYSYQAHDPYRHYSTPPDPPALTPSCHDNHPQPQSGPGTDEEFSCPAPQGPFHEGKPFTENETENDCFEPIKVSIPNKAGRKNDTREE